MRPNRWYEALHKFEQQGRNYVIVTLLQVAGSTPRNTGTKMIVSDDDSIDTIGGGHLEFEAIRTARDLLAQSKQTTKTETFPLSSKLGQCCGGAVKLLYEVRVNHGQHLAIFGAGHVAQALVPILAQLPLQIHWIDSREDLFNAKTTPANVNIIVEESPAEETLLLPRNTWLIVLTHNHQLDFDIVHNALKRDCFSYVGMIGSQTKAKRFVTRLTNKGISASQLTNFISPIGDLSIPGKRPVEVAVSISAQIIKLLQQADKQQAVDNAKISTVEANI
ncbi:xanthine dehydrogenase accessory protein XdhC [Glaciecola sp. 1036]|uniref:xanthine dehydrogenase accessory protein XdhC n=1 Tax=Alteromonadaceae TaxID=72275 RepID=UPI003CFFF012